MPRTFLLIGAGDQGNQWAKVVSDSAEWEIAGIVDNQAERLAALAEMLQLPPERCFADVHRAFDRVASDAVLIATPPGTHRAVTCAALAAGRHVLQEKPLALTWSDALAIRAAALACPDRVVMVNQNRRYGAVPRTMIRVVRRGELGRLNYAQIKFRSQSYQVGNYRAKMPHFALLERGAHLFDLIRAVLGREPLVAWAKSWNPPWSWSVGDACAWTAFDFEDGIKAQCSIDWIAHENETGALGFWTIEGERSALGSDGKRVWLSNGPGETTDVPLLETDAKGQMALESTLAEFTRAIVTGHGPETSVYDSIRSFAMSLAAVESVESGRPIDMRNFWADL